MSLFIGFPGTGVLYVDALNIWAGDKPPALEFRNPSVAPEGDPKAGKDPKGGKSSKGAKDGSGGNASKDAPEAAEPVKGNRIYNSSFELGAAGWSAPGGMSIEKAAAPDGERFARLKPGTTFLVSRPFLARPGQAYTFSAHVRSQDPSAKLALDAVEAQGTTRASHEVAVGSEWKRVSYTAVLPCEEYNRYVLAIRPASGSGTVDVDAVQVEEGSLSDYQPAAAVEVAAGLSGKALFPAPNEFVTIPVRVYSAPGVAAETVVGLRLEGFYGETVAVDSAVVPPGAHRADASFRVRLPQSGTLRAQMTASVNREVVSVDEAVLTVLPEQIERTDPFFGISGDPGAVPDLMRARLAARLGARSWRLDLLSRGHDAPVDGLRALGFGVTGVLGASEGSQAVDRYRGRLEALELSPSGADYRRALAAEKAALRRTSDDHTVLVGGDLKGTPEEGALARELGNLVDAVSIYQPVTPANVTGSDGKEPLLADEHRVREMLGPGNHLPLWNVGATVNSPEYHFFRGADERTRADARALARALALSKVNGVQRFFLSDRDTHGSAEERYSSVWTSATPFNPDGSAKPLLAAYGASAVNLMGAAPVGQLSTPAFRACVFHRDGECVAAIWAPDALEAAKAVELKLTPQQVDLRDVMGNPRGVRTLPDLTSVSVTLWNEVSYLHMKGIEPADAIALLREAKRVPPKEKTPKPAPAGAG